jgi:glycosyltransferase involved in cell wall biosynthesis
VNAPLVSVVVPAFNAARFLAEALVSIVRQEYQPLEIVVVDDGSSDGTAEMARASRARPVVIEQPNRGPAAARNRGIAAAKGDVIAFLDTDDLWPDRKLALQVPRLTEDASLDVVLGRIRYEALDDRTLDGIRFDEPQGVLTNVNLGAGVFRRNVFDRVGLFDESLRFSEDQDWFLRARELGIGIAVLGEVTLRYRLHAGNMTRGKSGRELALTSVLKRSLDRRRASARTADSLPHWSTLRDRPEKPQ